MFELKYTKAHGKLHFNPWDEIDIFKGKIYCGECHDSIPL